jgi:uncharacterized protein (DUF433 family)
MVEAKIIKIGRNPRISGTRITVYTIEEYIRAGWRPEDMAFWLNLTRSQVDAAIHYIEEHKEEVMAEYETIMDRINRGNPPEIQAKLDAVQGRARAMLKELRESKSQESKDEGHFGGQ